MLCRRTSVEIHHEAVPTVLPQALDTNEIRKWYAAINVVVQARMIGTPLAALCVPQAPLPPPPLKPAIFPPTVARVISQITPSASAALQQSSLVGSKAQKAACCSSQEPHSSRNQPTTSLTSQETPAKEGPSRDTPAKSRHNSPRPKVNLVQRR